MRDAHIYARNQLHERLPREVRLIRGWSRHPYMMVQEIDPSFDAAAFVGYHSKGGSGANPLAHTLTDSIFQSVRLTGQPVAELHLYAGAGALEGVPAIFVSGDELLCQEARTFAEGIETVATLRLGDLAHEISTPGNNQGENRSPFSTTPDGFPQKNTQAKSVGHRSRRPAEERCPVETWTAASRFWRRRGVERFVAERVEERSVVSRSQRRGVGRDELSAVLAVRPERRRGSGPDARWEEEPAPRACRETTSA